jgi:diguanylate cyclase (GGDEF)-like protein
MIDSWSGALLRNSGEFRYKVRCRVNVPAHKDSFPIKGGGMNNSKPYRVLIVDDNPIERATYRYLLSDEDGASKLDVLEAETGTEGLRRCLSEELDCVLLDYLLPDVDGLEFLTRLASDRGDMAVPVIMLTGYGDHTVAVRAMKGGATDYLAKGKVTENGLRRAITNAIQKSILRQQLYAQRQELERLATTDLLTDLPNRRVLLERLEDELRRFRRYGSPTCFLLLDVDHFKCINDKYGHLIGDQVLAAIGQLLHEGLRETDVAGRYGGEEFGVILPNTDLSAGRELAERLRLRFASAVYVLCRGQSLKITCSFGLTQAASSGQTATDLLSRADRALYKAKAGGRNQVHLAAAKSADDFQLGLPAPAVKATTAKCPMIRLLLAAESEPAEED